MESSDGFFMKIFKYINSRINSRIKSYNRRIESYKLMRKYQRCHDIAFKIVTLGQNNGKAQKALNMAKDSLYEAAYIFKEKANKKKKGKIKKLNKE